MAGAISFTLDLEDHRPEGSAAPPRYPAVTRDLLEWLGELGVRGTFFVVGTVADAQPALVGEIAARGHELALHGWDHEQLDRIGPAALAAGVRRGRALLEDLGQRPVAGYRAPTCSLTPATVWATDLLAEAGFTYSSSVLPARNPLYGWPGAPTHPFRWPCGLVELPATILGWGPARVPLGGTYVRALPAALLRRAGREPGSVPWLYCHAYDFDPGEPFWWEPVAGWMAPLLWVGRRGLRRKVERLLEGRAGPPLGERVHEATTTWRPGEA